MASGSYLDVPTSDGDINRPSEDTLAIRTNRSRPPSPMPRRQKQTSGHHGEAGLGSSVINLANTILGMILFKNDELTGRSWDIRYGLGSNSLLILAMPHAMSSMGVVLGISIIVFAGLTSGMGLYFLSRCALRIERGHSSFFAVAKRTYPEAAIVFDSAIAIKCFGIVGVGFLTCRRRSVISDYYWRLDASSCGEYLPRSRLNAISP
jgi:hypothetical protein